MGIEVIREMVETGKGFQAIRSACDGIEGEFWVGVFCGTQHGTTDRFPHNVERYRTMNHGSQSMFVASSAKVGDTVHGTYGGRWEVVAIKSVEGDAHMPSRHWFVAQKKEEV